MIKLLKVSRAIFAALLFALLMPLPVLALTLFMARHLDLSVTAMIKMTVTVMVESTEEFILFVIAGSLQKASSLLQRLIEHLTDAVRNVRSIMSIDHAVAAMQIPLSLISIIAESASVQVVGTAMIATVEGFLQYTMDAIYGFQLSSRIKKSIGGCILFIAIALTSWLFKVTLALHASRPYKTQPLSTPLNSLLGQDSTSEQRLDHPLSDHLPAPWVKSSDSPSEALAKLSRLQAHRHNSPSSEPPQFYTELPESQPFLDPMSDDARLRPFQDLPLDPEILGQNIEETRRRFSLVRLSSSATSGGV